MKEENKKKVTTTKKTTAQKKSPAKKTTSTAKKATTSKKVTTAKKAAPKKATTTKKTVATKKTTTTKKAAPKKTTTVKKEEVKKIAPIIEEEVIEFTNPVNEVKEEPVKKQDEFDPLIVRRVGFTIAGTLIMIFVVIGLIEFVIKPISVKNNENKAYIIQEKILDSKNILELNNAKDKLSNLNGNYFVYIAFTDNSSNMYFEKELNKVLESYDIKNKFYYINVDEVKDKENYIKIINEKLNYTDNYVTSIPSIIYVNADNVVTRENIISKEDNKIFKIGDLQQLLDINGFKEKK